MHLLGLDFYYRRKAGVALRLNMLARTYCNSTSIRMVRMLGAYGIGGVVNRKLRHYLLSKYEDENWHVWKK